METVRAPLSYRIAVSAASSAPAWALSRAAHAAGFVHYWLSGRKRVNYLSNAGSALRAAGSCPPWRAFQHQALNVLELLRAASGAETDFMDRMSLEGAEHIEGALSRGRGLILATFHSGNWELAGLMLASRGYPITTIAGEQLRPGWSEQVGALKERYGIHVARPGLSLRSLYRDIQRNRAVVLHIDGDLFEGGHEVTFTGKPMKAPRGPAHLSRVLACPVCFAYCRRTAGSRLRVIVEPPEDPPPDADGERRLTQTLIGRVEKCVLEDPGQWCIFRNLAGGAERPTP